MGKACVVWLGAALAAATAAAAESLVSVRCGEQDSCQLTGVTTSESQSGSAAIRFDLSKLKAGGPVKRAVLRLWVDLRDRAPLRRAFGIERFDDEGFDGLKVWQQGGPEQPLAISFPFVYTPLACHEWDVTPAVQAWVAKAAANRGLKTNFPLPANDFQPAWQRPYLEITFVGPNNADRPPQPQQLKAFYRCGQVFLTWKQVPYDGPFFDSTYRVYRHSEPITAANLDRAALVGEVNRNSQLNYRRTVYSRDGMGSYAGYIHFKSYHGVEKTKEMTEKQYWDALLAKIPARYNFVIDEGWPQRLEGGKWLEDAKVLGEGTRELKGPELSDDTGLMVYTVAGPGKVFFAVTSVVRGNENRQDFSPGNALVQPIEVKVERPRPVLQVVFHELIQHKAARQIREYVYWGGGGDGLHVEPSTPFYFRINPPPELLGLRPPRGPVWVSVEPWWSHGGAAVVTDAVCLPPTRLAPFPPPRVPFSRGGWREGARYYFGGQKGPQDDFTAPYRDRVRSLYGYHDRINTGADPRKAVVQPYFENRVLRELEYFFQEVPQASRDHVVMTGEGIALLMAMHHPEAFAFCSAAQERMWTSPRQEEQWLLVGKRAWQLRSDQGFKVWQYNDPVWLSQQFSRRAWPFISHCMSDNYDSADQAHWGESGYPDFYLAMAAEKRGGGWWWCDIGDAPHGKWVHIPRNQAYLAFTNVNFCEVPQTEWKKEPRGTLNGYLIWHHPEAPFRVKGETALPLEMVDTPERFEVSIRIGDEGLLLNGQSVPPTTARFGQTDITPWRLQQLKVAPGSKYLWTNRKPSSGQLLQAGMVQADDRGLLTVPGFFVDRDPAGNRLMLEPAAGKEMPKIDTAAKVAELSYAEYVKQCRQPELFPRVRPPQTTFTLGEFTAVRSANADGSISYKGGSFAQVYDTIVEVDKPGPYVIAARAKGEFGAAWPLLTLEVGGRYGQRMETKVIDTSDWAPYRWYAELPPGKLPIRLTAQADYYASPVLPELHNKRLHIAELSFTAVETAAKNRPTEIRVSPRRVTLPAGMTINFTAQVLNGLGQPLETPVIWKCSEGATIDTAGRFVAQRPGEYQITATVAGISQVAPVTVAERMIEDFNCGGNVLRFWSCFPLGDQPAAWYPPAAGHTFLNSLWQHKPAGKSVLLWDHGRQWTNYSVQVDVFLAPREREQPFRVGEGRKIVHGLVIRAAGKDDHYRLEIERRDGGSQARLVKRVGGKETVLASNDAPPALAAFDWQQNPMCPGWHGLSKIRAEEMGLHQWRMDRIRLEAVGDVLRAWVDGKELLPGGVKDRDLPSGTAGLYTENMTVMDNVEVRIVK